VGPRVLPIQPSRHRSACRPRSCQWEHVSVGRRGGGRRLVGPRLDVDLQKHPAFGESQRVAGHHQPTSKFGVDSAPRECPPSSRSERSGGPDPHRESERQTVGSDLDAERRSRVDASGAIREQRRLAAAVASILSQLRWWRPVLLRLVAVPRWCRQWSVGGTDMAGRGTSASHAKANQGGRMVVMATSVGGVVGLVVVCVLLAIILGWRMFVYEPRKRAKHGKM